MAQTKSQELVCIIKIKPQNVFLKGELTSHSEVNLYKKVKLCRNLKNSLKISENCMKGLNYENYTVVLLLTKYNYVKVV